MNLPYRPVKKEALDGFASRAKSTVIAAPEANGGARDESAAASRKRKPSLQLTDKMVHIIVANDDHDDDDNGRYEEANKVTFRVHEDVVHSYFPFFQTGEVKAHKYAKVCGEIIYNLSEYGSAQSMQVILDWIYLRELEESEITCEGLQKWGDTYNFAKFLQMPDFPTIITERVYTDFSKHANYLMENISQAYGMDDISEDYEWDDIDKVLLRIIAENTTPNELRRISRDWPQRLMTELTVFFMERGQGNRKKPDEDEQAEMRLSGKESGLPFRTRNSMTNEQRIIDISEEKVPKRQKIVHNPKEIQQPGDDSSITRRITRSVGRKKISCGLKTFQQPLKGNVATKSMTRGMPKMASRAHRRKLAGQKDIARKQAAVLRMGRLLGDISDVAKGWVESQSTRFLNQFAQLLQREKNLENAITKINLCMIDRLKGLKTDYPANGINPELVVQSKDIIRALQMPKIQNPPRVISAGCLLRHKLCYDKFGFLEPGSKERLADMARKLCSTDGSSTVTNTRHIKGEPADMISKSCNVVASTDNTTA